MPLPFGHLIWTTKFSESKWISAPNGSIYDLLCLLSVCCLHLIKENSGGVGIVLLWKNIKANGFEPQSWSKLGCFWKNEQENSINAETLKNVSKMWWFYENFVSKNVFYNCIGVYDDLYFEGVKSFIRETIFRYTFPWSYYHWCFQFLVRNNIPPGWADSGRKLQKKDRGATAPAGVF